MLQADIIQVFRDSWSLKSARVYCCSEVFMDNQGRQYFCKTSWPTGAVRVPITATLTVAVGLSVSCGHAEATEARPKQNLKRHTHCTSLQIRLDQGQSSGPRPIRRDAPLAAGNIFYGRPFEREVLDARPVDGRLPSLGSGEPPPARVVAVRLFCTFKAVQQLQLERLQVHDQHCRTLRMTCVRGQLARPTAEGKAHRP